MLPGAKTAGMLSCFRDEPCPYSRPSERSQTRTGRERRRIEPPEPRASANLKVYNAGRYPRILGPKGQHYSVRACFSCFSRRELSTRRLLRDLAPVGYSFRPGGEFVHGLSSQSCGSDPAAALRSRTESPQGSAPAPVIDGKLKSRVSGEQLRYFAKTFSQCGRSEQRIIAFAQVLKVNVQK